MPIEPHMPTEAATMILVAVDTKAAVRAAALEKLELATIRRVQRESNLRVAVASRHPGTLKPRPDSVTRDEAVEEGAAASSEGPVGTADGWPKPLSLSCAVQRSPRVPSPLRRQLRPEEVATSQQFTLDEVMCEVDNYVQRHWPNGFKLT